MERMGLNDQSKGWWRDAACYQVYVRSFADSDGDGIGDLPGITSRLPYLADLGVDALWITPFYPSPQNDHGYDVADYCDVDPLFGQLADADNLIERAHALGLRVIVDLVPNHTSDQHRWFQEALAAGPGSPERARYIFRDSETDSPPNNWQSVFGGPAWTRTPDGQWYLHLFDSTQPDLDWRNPEVHAMFEDVLRFWLDRGVDGFRIDVAHGLLQGRGPAATRQDPAAPPRVEDMLESASATTSRCGTSPRCTTSTGAGPRSSTSTAGDRMAVAEAWARPGPWRATSVPTSSHLAFNFAWLLAAWSAPAFAGSSAAVRRRRAGRSIPTWVLSNHDVTRHPTRYGGGERGPRGPAPRPSPMLGLPGSAYLYQGEELGLEEVDVPPAHRQDPAWFRTGGPGATAAAHRSPGPAPLPPFGFTPGAGARGSRSPTPANAHRETQHADPDSTLSFYRSALGRRRPPRDPGR